MSATVTPPLRLSAIDICGYRGFPNPISIRMGRNGSRGRNLLVYGENGSGKSSLGKALKDFLDFRPTAVAFDTFKYRYSDPARIDRGIKLNFDDGAEPPLEWNPTDRDKSHRQFIDMARSLCWLDYRVVWRASEVQWGDSVEIFKPLVEAILTGCPRGTSSETFGQAWAQITEIAALNPIKFGKQWDVVTKIQSNVKQFNTSLESFLPVLEVRANELLAEFVPWTTMKLIWKGGARYDSRKKGTSKFSHGSVRLQMIDRDGTPLKNPAEFLNEARLTAVGLCLYLAGMSQSIPPRRSDKSTYPRLLVLDDVLLSLDMAHRLPLLELVRARFEGWQIMLLTHDRAWYEIAKQRLEGWSHHEIFTIRVGNYEQPVLQEDVDHLEKAIDYLEPLDPAKGIHIKAAAVHVRTKFELVLKWACYQLGLSVKYNPESKKIPSSDFWGALKGATFEKIPPVSIKENNGVLHWWQPSAVETRIVSVDLETRIEHAVSWILNPLSHSQSVDRYRNEIEAAIFVINELEWTVRSSLTLAKGPVMLHQMLLSLIKTQERNLKIAESNPPVAAKSLSSK
jgi:energy-coupling factor transporter ATP-binding protein EcfA2